MQSFKILVEYTPISRYLIRQFSAVNGVNGPFAHEQGSLIELSSILYLSAYDTPSSGQI